MAGCNFDETAACALGKALGVNRVLRYLDLSENHLTGHGVEAVAAALHCNVSLETIHLDGVRAGIIGAEYLARALFYNESLRTITFSNNSIRNPGALAFASALGANVMLRKVDLSFNDFDAQGGAAIVAALANESDCDRNHRALDLHVNLYGNESCDELIPPHLARSKLRIDFL